MLTKAFILVLVMLIGLALGFETARYVHSAGGASTGMVNIHLAVFAGVLLAVLWVSRAWLARQWTRFTVWLELTLDGLFDFDALNVGDGLGSVSIRDSVVRGDVVAGHEACAQDALDDAAKTTCAGCDNCGHWSPDCPVARPPPSCEGRQPDGSYVIEVGVNETHEDVVRRHPEFIHGDFLFKQMGVAIDCAQEEAIRDYECQARKVGGLAHKRRTK